uniref:C-type lectin domain-containing protein n=1 Tax=Seriola lalandi dorsalis TaxID=1841481 RepID=A0A3B4XKT6_SERLL
VCVTGVNLYRLVALTFGLLCILQATLNISLCLALYASVCLYVQKGWVYFSDSIYYISSTKKTWQDSRNDCLQKGADLMIINSKEEQDFTRQSKKNVWIGLTDSETEGTWKWVDGTPLTTRFTHFSVSKQEKALNLLVLKIEKMSNCGHCFVCKK